MDHFDLWIKSGRINPIAIDNAQGQSTPAILFDLPVGATDREAANLGVEMMNLCGWSEAAAGGYDAHPASTLELDLTGDQVRLRGLEAILEPMTAPPDWIGDARNLGGASVAFAVLEPTATNNPAIRYEQARQAGRLWGGWVDLVDVVSHTADNVGLDTTVPLRTGMSPADLPRARDATAAWIADAGSNGATGVTLRANQNDTVAETIAPTLQGASLWWASRDMTILTATGQRTLPDARLEDLVDRRGLMCFDGGLILPVTGQVVDAISWAAGASGATVTAWAHRRRWPAQFRAHAEARGAVLPPFIPLIHGTLTGTRFNPGDLDADTEAIVTACCAGALIDQAPSINRSIERPPKRHRQAARRDGRTLPDVAVIDILRARRTAAEHREDTDAAGRTYTHQWLVQGHWRQQACGPGRTQRERIWIEPHFKGPVDAPLLVRERVNLWKR